jgi:hypothetical protein
MPFFSDADQLYATAQGLFTSLQEVDPGATDIVLASRLVARLRTTNPTAEITLNGRQRPVQFTYGPARVRPTLDIELSADTLHNILLGELPLKKALGNGKLKVRGQVWKALDLADLFYRGQAVYPQVLSDQGLAPIL